MKKFRLITLLVVTVMLFSHTACGVKEYNGKKITKLTYQTVDYFGGLTTENIFDFNENAYLRASYFPSLDEDGTPEQVSSFTDEAEKNFINACYTSGLFGLKESYTTDDNVMDGGEWTLTIEYEDGTQKISKGINADPYRIFDKCSTAFYDLCGRRITGTLPRYYDSPPDVSHSFTYYQGDNRIIISGGMTVVQKANYKWHADEATDVDIFALNNAIRDKNKFKSSLTYEFTMHTSNYDYEKKFKKFTLKQYDFNEALTNEKTLHDGKWFKQIEFGSLEINKIYVYEMTYKNGDYVQYTFNTYYPETVNTPTE